MLKNFYQLTFCLLVLLLFNTCQRNKPQKTEEQIKVEVPDFNSDTAYDMIQKQIDFGPRVSNSKANKKCALFLAQKLKHFIPNTIIQYGKMKAFDGTILDIHNIIASYHPENPNRIMLCSHWDSRPFSDNDKDKSNWNKPVPGANDGASGVGILIEIARQLSLNKTAIGIDIILFDTEDYGASKTSKNSLVEDDWCLGSQYWSLNPHKPNYNARYGILLDMVGASEAVFYMERNSMYYASDIMRKVWNTANDIGYANYFNFQETSAITDDHFYINTIKKIPTIDIIHHDTSSGTGFFPYWHTTHDDMSHIDKNTLKAVGQTLLSVIYNEK